MSDLFGDSSDGDDSIFAAKKAVKKKPEKKEAALPIIEPLTAKAPPKVDAIPPKQEEKIPQAIQKAPEPVAVREQAEEKEKAQPVNDTPPKKVKRKQRKPKVVGQPSEESSISKFKSEMLQKFDELDLQIHSIFFEKEAKFQHVSIPNKSVFEQVQAVASESNLKDSMIHELQIKIDNLSSIFNEKEEKEIIRKQINDLQKEMEELSRPSSDEAIEDVLKSLENEMRNIEIENKENENRQKNAFDEETTKMKDKINLEVKELQESMELMETSKEMIQQQLEKVMEDRTKIEQSQANSKSSEEVDIMRRKIFLGVQKILKEMVSGTFSILEEGVDEEREYSGQMCIQAIRTALSETADNILNPGGEEEEYESDD